MRRSPTLSVALVGLVGLAAGIGFGTAPTAAAAGARTCPAPPLQVRILPGPIGTTGPADFAVTDAVARRVPIVPRPAGATRDPATLDRLRAKAARTRLALYTMYLADFPVPRSELAGAGFGEITAPMGRTVAAVTVVPTKKRGFVAGDVAEVAPFSYESTTTFAPLSLVTNSSGARSSYAYDGITGNVTIRALTEKSICLDMDVAFTRGGQTVASAVGTVKAPVVEAAPAFFYT